MFGRVRMAGGLGGNGPVVSANRLGTRVGRTSASRSSWFTKKFVTPGSRVRPRRLWSWPRRRSKSTRTAFSPEEASSLPRFTMRGRLAFLGHGAGDEDDLPPLVLAPEDEGGAQVLVGLGDEVDVGLVVLRHRRQQVHVQVALDLLRVLDGVVEVVAGEHEADPEDQAQEGGHGGDPLLVGADGRGGGDGALDDADVVAADGGGDVRLVELLQEDVVEALGGLGLLLDGVQLRRLAALRGGLALLGVDGARGAPPRASGSARTPRAGRRRSASPCLSFDFCAWSTWSSSFWISGWPSLYCCWRRVSSLLATAIWALRADDGGSVANWGTASRDWLAALSWLICLRAASRSMRRAWASMRSPVSFEIELVTAEVLPSGTNRSWLW